MTPLRWHALLSLLVGVTLAVAGCSDALPTASDAAPDAPDTPSPVATTSAFDVPASQWMAGTTDDTVAVNDLQPMDIGFGGHKIWKSNNPEKFTGTGWLMQNARTDATRGGQAYPLTGCSNVYVFHINDTPGTRYLHLIVTNPNANTVTIDGMGSMYTNSERPLYGKGTGQSFAVSKDWLQGTWRTSFRNVSIQQYKGYQVYRATMNRSNMVDGRFEICAEGGGVYVYTAVTSTGSLSDALNKTQGSHASGIIKSETTNTYGREAGVYENSLVGGTTTVELPSGPSHIGFAFVSDDKFHPIQDQTADALMHLSDSASRSYGNYGHKYDVTLQLHNPHSTARTVKLHLGTKGTTWNSPALLNGAYRELWVDKNWAKPISQLSSWTVPANTHFNARLTLFVPGLISANNQLMLTSE